MKEEDIYRNCMEEVKERLNLIIDFFNQGRTTGSKVTDIEFGCLQFRNILELVILASIAPNKDEYAKQREKFRKDWNPRYIIKDLEKINPNFYPIPVEQIKSDTPGVNYRYNMIPNGFLPENDFLKIYEECGGVLHATNPFGAKKDLNSVRQDFQDWVNKIMALLRTHAIRLINDCKVWIVVMEDAEDKKVHLYTAEAMD
jgi:hypothetical protein